MSLQYQLDDAAYRKLTQRELAEWLQRLRDAETAKNKAEIERCAKHLEALRNLLKLL